MDRLAWWDGRESYRVSCAKLRLQLDETEMIPDTQKGLMELVGQRVKMRLWSCRITGHCFARLPYRSYAKGTSDELCSLYY